MADREPIKTTNLDIYGNVALPWSRAHALLEDSPNQELAFFLGTVRPNGHPHSAELYALWYDGDFYFVSGPTTRKSRNLAANPNCTISVRLNGLSLTLEGEAQRITDAPTLEAMAKRFRDHGWPVEVEGDAFTAPYNAPSAGKPPYYLYRFTFHTAFGVGTAEPSGATRWRFAR